jgi:hypothetical protein
MAFVEIAIVAAAGRGLKDDFSAAGVYLSAAIILAVANVAMLLRTGGRSGPVAATLFFIFGPVLGVVILGVAALREASRSAIVREVDPYRGSVFGLAVEDYAAAMLACGLAAGLIGSIIHREFIADELRALREEGDYSRPRPVAVPSFHALGLNAFATQEDVERAYRELALKLHPDHGGDAKQFARLQRNYELAKREFHGRGTAKVK